MFDKQLKIIKVKDIKINNISLEISKAGYMVDFTAYGPNNKEYSFVLDMSDGVTTKVYEKTGEKVDPQVDLGELICKIITCMRNCK